MCVCGGGGGGEGGRTFLRYYNATNQVEHAQNLGSSSLQCLAGSTLSSVDKRWPRKLSMVQIHQQMEQAPSVLLANVVRNFSDLWKKIDHCQTREVVVLG